MSSLVSKAGPESEWGSDSRIAAVRRWHEKSVASRHDQSVLLLDGADLRPGLRVLDLACGAGTPALAGAGWRGSCGDRLISRSIGRRLKSPCVTRESPSCRRRRHNRSASAAGESSNER